MLHERGFVVSRRRIGRIMKEQGLASTYTVAQYKPHKAA
ncbi:IS3 family transposase, partial [Paenibacillus farraposensis]|nr:IS3 family transposase [Paenibacillus farraposensis]